MRRTDLLAALLVLLAVLPAGAQEELVPFNEAVHRRVMEESRGQVVLYNFWASWCEPCRQEMPVLARLEERLGSQGFRLVNVSADTPSRHAAALEFLRQTGVSGTQFVKSTSPQDKFIDALHQRWGGTLPALFLYRRDGKLAARYMGSTPVARIVAAVENLVNSPAPDPDPVVE